ncbi:MAG: hypothetical protein U9Q07_04230 [Planctomycetota bacterium]|nr:hypothetical protein [Planctomycetota bacterium]
MTEEKKTPFHIAEQIFKKSWAELEATENNGRLLFPDKIYKRNAKGEINSIDVMLQVPREDDNRFAKLKARELGIAAGADLDRDKDDIFEQLEMLCLLWRCIRNTTPPYEPLVMEPLELEKFYDLTSLVNVYGKIDTFAGMLNPHVDELAEEDCWALVGAIATSENILPLHVCAPDSQNTFVLFMADQLSKSQAYKSYLESQEGLTPAQSPSSDSDKS